MGKKKRTKKQLELDPKPNGSTRELEGEGNGESEWLELSPELEARVMLVTPELAARWLERNHEENRPIRWQVVEAVANDIRGGHYKLTHQAIAFGADGTLLDGQHRLSSVVAAAVPVRMLIIRNREGAFSDPIDRGRPRGLAMLLRVSGKDAAALNMLRWLELGGPSNVPATASDLGEMLSHHEEAIKMIKTHVKGAHAMLGSVMAACVWTLPCEPDRVLAFAYKVQTGEMLQRGDPAFAWRSWKQRNPGANQWDNVLAALNCVRYFVTATPMASVYTGDTGYQAVTAKRRTVGAPNTPGPDLVPYGVAHWKPSSKEAGEVPNRSAEVVGVEAQAPLRVTPAEKRGGMPGVDPFRPRGS